MNRSQKMLILGGVILLTAVLLGAFGAHGLEKILTAKAMRTYQTGVTYQFYHGFALLILTLIAKYTKINLIKAQLAFTTGIILFSFNCYLYAYTGIKTFAMIVPIGGVSFIIGWGLFIYAMVTNSGRFKES